ncbi:MAG: amidase, partial [Pseudomonadota bacterium]
LTSFDAIITLSSPGSAPMTLESTGNPIFNGLWTYLGVPTLTLPLLAIGNMPCGVTLAGARRGEAHLFRVARWLDEAARQNV